MFHSKRSIIRILPLFAVLIVVFTLTTTKMIEGFVFLLNLSAPVAETLGEDNVMTISKFTATFIMGLVNFAICKKFIFKDEADGKA